MARFQTFAVLALLACVGAASASRTLMQAGSASNPGEAVGQIMGDILRGVAANRPYTPGPLPNPFEAAGGLADALESLGLPNPARDLSNFLQTLGLPTDLFSRPSAPAVTASSRTTTTPPPVPNPEIEVSIEPELTLGLGLGLTPLDLSPTLDLSATPLDLTLSGEVGVSGAVEPGLTASTSVKKEGGDNSVTYVQPSTSTTVEAPAGATTTVAAAQGAAQGFKNALSKLG